MAQQTVFENDKAHEFARGPSPKKVQVTFEIALDAIPGWGHRIEDHVQQLFLSNPYVVRAVVHSDKD